MPCNDEHVKASSETFSDEQILEHEHKIRDEIAASQPLVCPSEPVSDLTSLFKNDPIRQAKIGQIRLPLVRRVRGDGDCFYRVIALGFLESLGCKLFRDTLTPLYQRAGYEPFVYDIFFEELPSETSDFARLWNESLTAANSAVMLVRLAASAEIIANRLECEPFVFETTGVDDLVRQCQCLGSEADHLSVMATAKALDMCLEVSYLDASPGDLSVHLINETGKSKMHLLYRPGHYDLLLPQ